jgi:DNA invertase Pin-like site-specific DNA recombinase
MKHVAIYVRVSSEDQVHGTSLATQEEACRRWCAQNDARVVRVFSDQGETAKTANRPAFIQLVASARKRQFDTVLVYKLDRFARQAHDFHVYNAILIGAGVSVVSATEPFSDDPVGRLLQTMLAGIAQFDNEIRSERCRTGMAARALAGYWFTVPPAGMVLNRTEGGMVLEPHPVYAPIVQQIIESVAAGEYTDSVRQELPRLGLAATREGVHRLVKQPAYAGLVCSELTDHKLVPAKWPGIVPRDTWERAVDALRRSGRPVRPHTTEGWPLRSWLRCAECGRGLTGGTSRGHGGRYAYYFCPTPQCSRIARDKLHADMALWMRAQCLRGRKVLVALRIMVQHVAKTAASDTQKLADQGARELDALNARGDKIFDGWSKGLISEADCRRKVEELQAAKTEIAARIEVTQNLRRESERVIDTASYLLTHADELWLNSRTENQRKLQVALWGPHARWSPARGFEPELSAGVIGALERRHPSESRVAYLGRLVLNLRDVVAGVAGMMRAA